VPEVSVIIPTRDRYARVSLALHSVLWQREVDLEVIVVDDGSVDQTAAKIGGASDPRVRVLRNEVPLGESGARNRGLEEIVAPWVAFLDDDDLWAPRKLRAQIDAASAGGAVFAYTAAAWLDERRRFLHALAPPPAEHLAERLLRWNEIWAGGSNVLARTDVVRRLGGFDERLFQLADWDLWLRLALAGEAAAIDDVLVGYVVQPESMLLTDRRDVFAEFRHLVDKHRETGERLGAAPDAAKFVRWVAAGHLRAGRRRRAAATYARGAVATRRPGLLPRAAFALVGPRAFGAARAASRALRGDDPAKSADAEPEWLERYR
jgi:glycosyltransferase involved in cell wall biosynthesis